MAETDEDSRVYWRDAEETVPPKGLVVWGATKERGVRCVMLFDDREWRLAIDNRPVTVTHWTRQCPPHAPVP